MFPQQRKEIYEEMLQDFEADKEYTIQSGFCRWLVNKFPEDWRNNFLDGYPELLKQKPKENVYGCYWWNVSPNSQGRLRRIEVIKKAIKQVNKLI